MSEIDEVVMVENKNKRLSNLKKFITSKHGQLLCDLIKVVTGTGAPYACIFVEDKPTNTWAKLCNGLWDPLIGVFRGCDAPTGSKRMYYTLTSVLEGHVGRFSCKHQQRNYSLVVHVQQMTDEPHEMI